MTANTISDVTLTHAIFERDGKPIAVEWSELIRAADQDDGELAPAYREILATAIPLLATRERDVYETYCGAWLASTRETGSVHSIGHGSWVGGPRAGTQEAWYAWSALAKRVAAATREVATAIRG